MYHLEIINNEEILLLSKDYKSKIQMLIDYKRILHNLNTCNQYKGNTIQLFEGVNYESMQELIKYRKDL